MMRSEQNFYNQRADLNMEVQILVNLLREVYIALWRPYAYLKESRPSGIFKCFLLILWGLYFLIVILPVIIVWCLILGPTEVKDMHDEALRMVCGEKLGYCGLTIAYQRSEDVQQEDEWLGIIRTFQQEIKSNFASMTKQLCGKIESV